MSKKSLFILCICLLSLGWVATAKADIVSIKPKHYAGNYNSEDEIKSWNVQSNLVDTISYDEGTVTTSTGGTYKSHRGGQRTGGSGATPTPIAVLYQVGGVGDPKELFTLDTRRVQSNYNMNVTSLVNSSFSDQKPAPGSSDIRHANSMDARKQDLLQTLFNHTYSSIFDESGNYVDVNVRALQMAIWEVMYEVESTTYVKLGEKDPTIFTPGLSLISDSVMPEMGDGGVWIASQGAKFEINLPAERNSDRSDYDLANFWLGALTSDDPYAWTSNIYGDYSGTVNWDLAVYTTTTSGKGNLIGVNGGPDAATTPEPASLLILGVGLCGLPLCRRLRRKTA